MIRRYSAILTVLAAALFAVAAFLSLAPGAAFAGLSSAAAPESVTATGAGYNAPAEVMANVIHQESFETDGEGIRYTTSNFFNDGTSDHYSRTNGTDIGNVTGPYSAYDGAYFWAAEDTDDNGGDGLDEKTMVLNTVDISGYSNTQFKGLFGAGNENGPGASGYDAADYAIVYYSVDGAPFTKGLEFRYVRVADDFNEPLAHDTDFDGIGDGALLGTAMQEFTFTIPSGNSVVISFTVSFDSGNEEFGFDNLRIEGDATAPALSISKSVTPTTNVTYHSNVTYTVLLANNGTDATGVLFTDTLPAEVGFDSWITQPAGAIMSADEITWTGSISASEVVTFAFMATHVGNYEDVVINTAEYSHTTSSGTADAAFTVESSGTTLVYHDLEDVVQGGESVYLAGDFNSWTPALMTANGDNSVFTLTLMISVGSHEYKYIVNDGNEQWDWLNTSNRSVTVPSGGTVNDYRNVAVGWGNLQWPSSTATQVEIPTENIYGRLYVQNVTPEEDAGRGLLAQLGYGTDATPSNWTTWSQMSYYGENDSNNDEYTHVITPTATGVYSYQVRYDGNWGPGNPNQSWTYADLSGMGIAVPGILTVTNPSLSITKAATPTTDVGYHGLVTYTVVLSNGGDGDAAGTVFTDALPAEVDFLSWVEQPLGAVAAGNVITWTGQVTASEAITFTFVVTHTGGYGDVVENTAMFSHFSGSGSASATFEIGGPYWVTFIYYDLEDVVQMGESIDMVGDFDGWGSSPVTMTANIDNSVFTATLLLSDGTDEYKYRVQPGDNWDWLNTANRSLNLTGNMTVHSYRNVTVDWANLDSPATIEITSGMSTGDIFGQLYIQNVTNPAGEGRGLQAQVGYGADADPGNWTTWQPMAFDSDLSNNDLFTGVLTPTGSGVYSYAVRYDGNGSLGNPNGAWTYGDLDGSPFDINNAGVMTVTLPGTIAINEADADMSGTEVEEFIELYDGGTGNMPLSGMVVVLYNGSSDTSYRAIDLDGYSTDANGYFVIGGTGVAEADLVIADTYWLQNGADGIGLYLGDEATFPDGTPVVTDTAILVDALVYDTDDGDDPGLLVLLNPGQPQVDEDGAGDKDLHSNQRCPNGSGGPRNTDTYAQYDPTPGSENTCTIPPTADLELSKSVDNPNPDETDTIVFTLNVHNNPASTADATGVVVQDYLPDTKGEISYGGDSCGASVFGNTLTWNVGTILSGTSATCKITATIQTGTDGSVLVNYAEVFASDQYDSDSTPGNFSGSPAEDDEAVAWITVGTPAVCGTTATFIHNIQGSGDISPVNGETHTIEGVVVADYQTPGGGIDGFFVQEEDGDADGDPMTSEGIFVYDGFFGFSVEVGDVVRVTGTVDEYNNLTELTNVSDITLCGTGAAVTPASVTLPISDTANWEWYEGMLLNIPQTLYVTEHYYLGRYGEISLSVNDRLDIPTQVVDPGADANTLQDLNNRSRVQLDDAAIGQNPDPIIYPSPELSATNTLRGGDTLPELTGVVNYSFGAYLIEPVGPITFTHSNPRPAAPDPVAGSLQVASFNVLNYFTTIDTGAAICGPNADQSCRGADSAFEFTRQRDKIITAILAIDADVVGLMEIENHATDDALDDLVDGLNAIAGAGTYAKVVTPPIGDDAIKVALIYKPATVTPVGTYAILDNSFDPNYHDEKNRPALAQTFEEIATGESVTVIVNHFKSKGSDCDDIGDPDTGDGQGNCNLTRTAAATIMLTWLATDPTASGSSNFLIIGDLNSYAMEDPITALETGGFTDLYNAFGGDDYSYVYSGQWGTLDYSLASAELLPYVTGATAWHINADEPIVLDYNEEYQTPHHVESLYAPDAYRASDHDPIIVGLDLGAEAPTASFMSNSPVTLGEVSVFTNTSTSAAPMSYLWDFGDGVTSTLESPTHTYALTGTYVVTLTATNAFGSDTYTATHAVEEASVLPAASFTSNSPVTLGEVSVFTNTSTGDASLAYVWDFGDGVTSTLESPTHTYALTGTYVVTLTATNAFGSDTYTATHVVEEAVPDTWELYLPLISSPAPTGAMLDHPTVARVETAHQRLQ